MTSAGVVRSWGERLRTTAVRLAYAGGLAAVAWLAGAVTAHADETPARVHVLSPSTVSDAPEISATPETAQTDAVARAGGLGDRIRERTVAKIDQQAAFAPAVAEDEGIEAKGGGMATTDSDEVQPLPVEPAPRPAGSVRTAKSAEGSASAVRPVRPVPPPAPEPAPAPVEPVAEEPVAAAPSAPLVRPAGALRTVVPQTAEPPPTDRAKHEDVPDLPGPDPRKQAPSAPTSSSLSGSASDNGGARGATALVTAPLPELPKPSLVTVERPRNAGSPHNAPGLPPTSPD